MLRRIDTDAQQLLHRSLIVFAPTFKIIDADGWIIIAFGKSEVKKREVHILTNAYLRNIMYEKKISCFQDGAGER